MAFPQITETQYTEINTLTASHTIVTPINTMVGSMLLVAFSCSGANNPRVNIAGSSADWKTIRQPGETSPELVIFWKIKTEMTDQLVIDTDAPCLSISVAHALTNADRVSNSEFSTNEYNNTTNARPPTIDLTPAPRPRNQTFAALARNIARADLMWLTVGAWGGTGEATAAPVGTQSFNTIRKSAPQAINEPQQIATAHVNARSLSVQFGTYASSVARWRAATLVIYPKVATGVVSTKLEAVDTVESLLGISEGEIVGPVDGLKSIFFNDTPLQDASGNYNIENIDVDFYPGTELGENVTMRLGGISNNISVSVTLNTDTPVIRTTTQSNIDYIDVRLTIDRLLYSADSGPSPSTIHFTIEFKPTASSTWTKLYNQDIIITGLTTSKYPRDFRIPVQRINGTYDIRVTKLTAPNTTRTYADLTFESIQEITADIKPYPNTAMIRFDAQYSDQLSGFPTVLMEGKGRIVKLPTNYDPDTRQYTGAWDGTWKMGWTNNPAFILYDYVMSERFGMKSYYQDITLDKYDVYEAAQWCDVMVPDGRGGLQPRYTFSVFIQDAMQGKELAYYIAGVFNSTFFDDLNGTAFLRVDKDDQAVQIFTPENVINGDFDYSYTDITSRYNDITVSFVNPELGWNEDRRQVKSDELIAKYGRIPFDFVAVGCTNAHEAQRRAMYKLITQNTETRLVKFQTNRNAAFLQPFDVILVSDPDMGWGMSGRISTLDAAGSVTLRDPLYFEPGIGYSLRMALNDGTVYTGQILNTGGGDVSSFMITPAPDLSTVPTNAAFTVVQQGGVSAPRPFRVLKIAEADGNPDAIEIEAVNINRNKWSAADNAVFEDDLQYSNRHSPLNPPGAENVSFVEEFSREDRAFKLRVIPYFNRRAYPYYNSEGRFEVWSRLIGSDDAFERRDMLTPGVIMNHPPGNHEFKVLAISTIGSRTTLNDAATWTFNVTNPLTPPEDVEWATIDDKEIRWVYPNPPVDFEGFELRYQNIAGKTSWQDAVKPHEGVLTATSFYTNQIPNSARVILIRAVDVFGVVSQNSAVILRDANVEAVATNLVQRYDYHDTEGANILVEPRNLTAPEWVGQYVAVTANVDPGPSGEGLADSVMDVYDPLDVKHSIYQSAASDTSIFSYFSVQIKPVNKEYVEIRLMGDDEDNAIIARFDLTNGVPVFVNETGGADLGSADITSLGGGWYLLQIEGVPNTNAVGTTVVELVGVGKRFSNDPSQPMYGRTGGLMYPDGPAAEMYKSATFVYDVEYQGNPTEGYIYDNVTLLDDLPAWYGEKIGCAVDPFDGYLKANSTATFYSGSPSSPMYPGGAGALMYNEVYSFFDYITTLTVAHPGQLLVNADYVASGYSVMIRPAQNPPAPWTPAGDAPWLNAGPHEILVRVQGGQTRGELRALTVLVDAEDEMEYLTNIEIGALGTRLPIVKTYSQIKVVQVSILEDGGTAVSSIVVDQQNQIGDGPLVQLRDANNNLVSGRVSAIIRGYL